MKTRLRTNEQKTSYQLDVIINHVLETYYFKTEKEALDFQKFTIELNQYKDYI
jgi:hypothetical protein